MSEQKKQELKKESKTVIQNVCKNPHKIYGEVVQPGGKYEVKAGDKENEQDSKRLANAIKQGKLKQL